MNAVTTQAPAGNGRLDKLPSTRNAALFYAALGWPIFPVWPMRGGDCACGLPNCGEPANRKPPEGKHPIGQLAPQGVKNATIDTETISAWWDKYPDANIGMATGAPSGVYVVDIDPGKGGEASWDMLLAENDPLPDTVESETGGGGRHIFFQHVAGLGNTSGRLGVGIDTRGDGGYVILPPSNHRSGNRYEWELSSHPGHVEPAGMPGWLLALLTAEKHAATAVNFSANGSNGAPDLAHWRLSEINRAAILHGPQAGADRSAIDQSVITALVRAGATDDDILAVFEHYPIGEKFTEKGKNGRQYLATSIGNARGFVGANGRGPQAAPGGAPAAPGAVANVFSYRAEDGGILDAWEDLHGARWLFAAGFEQWYTWAVTHWREDHGYALLAEIQSLIDAMNRQAREARDAEDDPEKRKRLTAYVNATKRTRARVGSVEGMARNLRWVDGDKLNSVDVLNLQNGTLDLHTLGLNPHSEGDLLTYCLPYAYDPAAVAPAWASFIADIEPETADFLQEFAGYSLTADTKHETAVWLYGPPGGGKSTFLGGLQAMLGPKAGALGLADIERSRFALADLPGKTLVVSAEQPGDFLASTHILNAIISGEPVTVDRKFKDAVQITPRAKVAWAMNDFPRVSDANNGIFRRVKVVNFPAVPEAKRRPELKDAIAGEGAGILNWALAGLARLQARGRFAIPAAVATATRDFINQNDIPANFVADCCVTGWDYTVSSAQIYDAYRAWALATGHKPQSSTSVAGDWRRMGFEKYLANGRVFWRGVGLRAENM